LSNLYITYYYIYALYAQPVEDVQPVEGS